jgi:hypothetical protein
MCRVGREERVKVLEERALGLAPLQLLHGRRQALHPFARPFDFPQICCGQTQAREDVSHGAAPMQPPSILSINENNENRNK